MNKILVVTSNPNKVREFKEILEPYHFEIISLLDFSDAEEIPENGNTFVENAIIKAEYGMKKFNHIAIADDSGLVVNGLNGEPGIHSARYLGRDTSYTLKNLNIIERLEGIEDRSAAFHCAIALAIPNQETKVFEGIMEGEIAHELSGSNGFGYDPIFLVPKYGVTSATLTPKQKNEISHRGQAIRMLMDYLNQHHLDITY